MLHTDLTKRHYSYTALSNWLLCQRRFYWAYRRNLVLDVPAAAPHFGQAIHAGLHRWYETGRLVDTLEAFRVALRGAPADVLRTPEKGELILTGYTKHYPQEPFTLLANEVEFAVPMPNGSTIIGRIDRVIQWGERILVKETKTTSGGIGAAYFKGFSPNLQIDMECYAVAQHPRWGHCDGALIDAIQVCKTKEGYARDLQDRTPHDLAAFERRYARIVHDLEVAATAYETDLTGELVTEQDARNEYLQNQMMCTYFGECPYRRLCLYNDDGLIEGHYKLREVEPQPTPEAG